MIRADILEITEMFKCPSSRRLLCITWITTYKLLLSLHVGSYIDLFFFAQNFTGAWIFCLELAFNIKNCTQNKAHLLLLWKKFRK
jgi:hypothetical protein